MTSSTFHLAGTDEPQVTLALNSPTAAVELTIDGVRQFAIYQDGTVWCRWQSWRPWRRRKPAVRAAHAFCHALAIAWSTGMEHDPSAPPVGYLAHCGHEALETVGDPLCNIWRDIDPHTQTAQEMCDAVEATGYRHDGADLTNFLLPAWFNPFGKPPFDYLGQLTAPFTMTDGGYMLLNTGGTVSQQTNAQMPDWRKQATRTRAGMRGLTVQ